MCSKFLGKEELIHILIKPYFEITVDSHMKFCLLFIHVSPNNNIFQIFQTTIKIITRVATVRKKEGKEKKKKKLSDLKQHKFIIFLFWRLEVWNETNGAKMGLVIKARVSRGKCIFFFWLFKLRDVVCILQLSASWHLHSKHCPLQSSSYHIIQTLFCILLPHLKDPDAAAAA